MSRAAGRQEAEPAGIAGLRLPGRGRLLVAQIGEHAIAAGDWAVVQLAWGEEAGQVVVTPDRVALAPAGVSPPAIVRLASAAEVERVAELAERALRSILDAARVVGEIGPGASLVGLRFTLDGRVAVASLISEPTVELDRLRAALSEQLGTRVEFEGEPGAAIFGSLGRLTPRYSSLAAVIQARLDPPGVERAPMPEGLPRLGSRVETRAGPGSLLAVSLRRKEATVALDDGEEITVPLSEPRPATG